MSDQHLHNLMLRYYKGATTPEEEEELMQLLDSGNEQVIKEIMDVIWRENESVPPIYTPERSQELLREILPVRKLSVRKNVIRWSSAAAVLLLIAAGGWWLSQARKGAVIGKQHNKTEVVRPGGNKATLTLANGDVITLEDAENGALSTQGGTKIIKLKSGQLAYNSEQGTAAGTPAALNTLATPRGGQYQVTLPDGTEVWLNSASSITFPTKFTGSAREVQVKGEAYFEVAANARQPFLVKTEGMEVQVLGTSFNLMAYSDEKTIRTTLVQGAVKVVKDNRNVLLQPGQQARLDADGGMKVVKADLESTLAWKNGLFTFNDATIEDVMRQISRWYDMEVVYPEGIPHDLFRGEMFRSEQITSVLKILEASGVNFRVEGRKIIVKP
ncbi:MAG TPA: FecR domain-containing protein [Chitinophaga sp.]|nr:FecR domain-containing protein [Chitinophaga sp.]